MSEHTFGPWTTDDVGVIRGDNDRLVAHVYQPRTMPDDEIKANARLIAASPTLLEALEDLLEAIPSQNKGDWWPDELTHAVRDAKAAITKATGGEQC